MRVLLHHAHGLWWGWLFLLLEFTFLYLFSPSIGIDQAASSCSLCLPFGCAFLDGDTFVPEFFVVRVF